MWGRMTDYSVGCNSAGNCEKMTYVGQNEYQQSVYTLQISADCKGLIFTNGSGAQTVDITSGIKENGGYYISGNASGKYSVGTYTYQK